MVENLTVLIVGNGAREHALSCTYEEDPQFKKIVVAPENSFISHGRKKEVITEGKFSLKSSNAIVELAKKHKPDIIDVAQDDAIAAGTVNKLQKEGFVAFGPTIAAAQLESNKVWSRNFMHKYGIPHPRFRHFNSEIAGEDYARSLYTRNPRAIVYVKASGLTRGKGALKSTNLDEAIRNIRRMKEFPDFAGEEFLIEESLVGEEFSSFAISDGEAYRIFEKSAQDNKSLNNFGEGPMTGGMGAHSPAMVTNSISKEIDRTSIAPVISGMRELGTPFTGILYVGGIVVRGKPEVIEYNDRFGDPEAQVILPGVKNYPDLVIATVTGNLRNVKILQDRKTRVGIVGAFRGYPNDHSTIRKKRIYGLEQVMKMHGVQVFGSGITVQDGEFYANHIGRLFTIVAEGDNIREARELAYAAIARVFIEDDNLHYRTDIASRDMQRFLKSAA